MTRIFTSPAWVPSLAPVPDTALCGDHVLGSTDALAASGVRVRDPIVCALTGRSYSADELRGRVDRLARSLSRLLGWSPNVGNVWDKMVGIYSVNTVDFAVLSWAVHRLGGACLTLHASSAAVELVPHLTRVRCSAIFTCAPLLAECKKALKLLDIGKDVHLGGGTQSDVPLYLLDVATQLLPEGYQGSPLTTVEQLIGQGVDLPQLEGLRWKEGQGAEQLAYLCPTSGTSGVQKLAKITHRSLLANSLQAITYELPTHEGVTEVALNFLPLSHIYGLMLVHSVVARGDCMVLHPQFDLNAVLQSIATHRIQRLYLVPPIIALFTIHPVLLDINDLSSVTTIVSGAAPFPQSLAEALKKLRPEWDVLPGWGLTEGGGVSTLTTPWDFVPGSSGSVLSGVDIRLVDESGRDVEEYGQRGEIWVRSPSLVGGYVLDGDDAERDRFLTPDGWLRTGDVGLFRLSPKGFEHLFVIDRTKDMIKVKGMQVAPADLESHLLSHPIVTDAAVIGVPDAMAGELPQAFVVVRPQALGEANGGQTEDALRKSIAQHVQDHMSQPHWLDNRIIFMDEIPKSASGKILKRLLKDRVGGKPVSS